MKSNTSPTFESQVRKTAPLRALVEITGGELKIFPIADSDGDEQLILDALRFVRDGATQ